MRDSELVKSAAFDVLLTDVYALGLTLKYFSVNGNTGIVNGRLVSAVL